MPNMTVEFKKSKGGVFFAEENAGVEPTENNIGKALAGAFKMSATHYDQEFLDKEVDTVHIPDLNINMTLEEARTRAEISLD